jgi:transposase InsO family protein
MVAEREEGMEDETKRNRFERAADEGERFDPIALPVAETEAPRVRLGAPKRGKRLAKAEAKGRQLTGEQRLLILDSWKRSGLPAGDFAPLVGLSKHTLYLWKQRFEAEGPAALMSKPRGPKRGGRVAELTKRAIVMLKEANPQLGCERISDMLARGPALGASASTVARVLHEAGYELEESPTRPHPDKPRRFERAKANELWQTDLFTFVLKRQNRRVYLVGFMDDHSRFLVSYGLHASQSTALVLEALRSGLTNYGAPKEILTDNGTQYVTWRGTSQFTKELRARGIGHVVAKPRRPQTLGKIERFWGTLWRECVEAAVFRDLDDARQRIGHFIDHYNFHRPHQGLDGLVPADRFFGSAPQVLAAQKKRVAENALELARHGTPKQPLYLTGQAGGRGFTVHSEGERVILTREGEPRQEVDLSAPAPSEIASSARPTWVDEPSSGDEPSRDATDTSLRPTWVDEPSSDETATSLRRMWDDGASEEAAPGTSPLDDVLAELRARFGPEDAS